MARQKTIHFYPERIGWIGIAVLAGGFLFSLFFFPFPSFEIGRAPLRGVKKEESGASSVFPFSFGLQNDLQTLPMPNLEKQIVFSFDPPRPHGEEGRERVLVCLKPSGAVKRVLLPCRLDLKFDGSQLAFGSSESLFWIDLSLNGNGLIEGKGSISDLKGNPIETGLFSFSPQDPPVQEASLFAEGSPFRRLAEGKWWGKDQFRGGADLGERIEVGSELIELRQEDWLVWKNGKWEKGGPDGESPIARIQSISPKALYIQGWDRNDPIRISLPAGASPPLKGKGEELFGSLRIRSEKQISCMLEKQCMVLKTGDWVLKSNGRWKVLRKKEDRDAFLNGKLVGELFILDQISHKPGQKMIHGRFFNPARTQVAPIEVAAQSPRRIGEKGIQKGRTQ